MSLRRDKQVLEAGKNTLKQVLEVGAKTVATEKLASFKELLKYDPDRGGIPGLTFPKPRFWELKDDDDPDPEKYVKGDVLSYMPYKENQELIILSDGYVFDPIWLKAYLTWRKTRAHPMDSRSSVTDNELHEMGLTPNDVSEDYFNAREEVIQYLIQGDDPMSSPLRSLVRHLRDDTYVTVSYTHLTLPTSDLV